MCFILLQEVLEEIEEERRKQALTREELLVGGEEDDNGIVLVACKDERSCMQLEECIMNGQQKVCFSPPFLSVCSLCLASVVYVYSLSYAMRLFCYNE